MCGAHDALYELTAYRDPNLIPIKSFYEPCPKVNHLLFVRLTSLERDTKENCYVGEVDVE